MAFAAVQTVSGLGVGGAGGYSTTISASVANNLIVVTIVVFDTTTNITSVTDNQGNTYVLSSKLSNTFSVYQAYAVQTIGGVTSVTVTKDGAQTIIFCVDEYSGGATSNAGVFDASTTGTGNGTTVSASTLNPANTGELIIASMFNGGGASWTAGSGFTMYGTGVDDRCRSMYNLSGGSSETGGATISGTNDWGIILTAFKPFVKPPFSFGVLNGA